MKNEIDSKLVSAIITTHNRAPIIVKRAIKSVINQTYRNIEIIVIDDSTPSFPQREEVEQIIRTISDEIIYIKHDSNQGSCVARNTGLRHAHGYYVAFLDDDDEWLPGKIEEQIKGFCDESIALVYGGIVIVDEEKNREYTGQYNANSGRIFEILLKKNIIGTTSNPMIRKDVIEDVGGFDILMHSSQDFDLWLRIVMKYAAKSVNQPLVKYHIHSGERISTNIEKKISGLERINQKYAEYIENDNEIWYIRHIVLIPYYLKKYCRMKSFATWACCVHRQPFRLINNMKYLSMIFMGNDLYSAISERIHRIIYRANDCCIK